MSKLKADQKTIENFMGERKNFFLIPDYQRPYTWDEDECITLWNDIFSFCFPYGNNDQFNDNDEYFLGSLVIFKNSDGKFEIIDGQQRLITLTLLLRAFYNAYGDSMTDEDSHDAKRDIAKCIWKTPGIGQKLDMSALKISSLVASDNDNDEFLHIMLTGQAEKTFKGRYAENYRLFQRQIKDLQENYSPYFSIMPARILSNCSLLPIEAEGQDTALRIFSTLNDRGKPLSDSDIFKAKLYRAYDEHQQKDYFIERWKYFEAVCEKIIVLGKSNPIDTIFMRYMFYIRATKGIIDTSVDSLRDFYGRDNERFSLLRRDYERTFNDLITLAEFWRDVALQDKSRFTDKILKSLFVLHYLPNNIWTFLVSVYFMTNKNFDGILEENKFHNFLQRITAFILASRIMRAINNTTPFIKAMVDIAEKREVTFAGYLFNTEELRQRMLAFDFNDNRHITRGMIAWNIFQDTQQKLLSLEISLETEHIFPRRRKGELQDEKNFDALGNKSLLEKNINIRASDYRFRDRAKYYLGHISGKPKTDIHELQELATTHSDFTEQDIISRNTAIIDKFITFIEKNQLAK